MRKVTAEYLTTVGYTVETAINGFDALEKFERGRFDLVVSDQGMPDMSGDRLAGAVKERSPGTPVILLTGAGRTEQATPEDIAGVDLILSKPLTMSVLRDALAKLGARKQPKTQEISAGRS